MGTRAADCGGVIIEDNVVFREQRVFPGTHMQEDLVLVWAVSSELEPPFRRGSLQGCLYALASRRGDCSRELWMEYREMGVREGTKTITKKGLEEPARELLGQRKRPEKGQFLLQVDRQTKTSYATYEAAEGAGLVIKRGHPIVQVAVYDAVAGVKKIIELLKS